MAVWKVLFVLTFALVCFVSVLATIIVPMTMVESGYRWVWLAGLLFSSLFLGMLFAVFLRSADRAFGKNDRRY
jgi:hypothetical protein